MAVDVSPAAFGFVVVNALSARGDGIANDDAIGWFDAGAHADFWVIDGATSVADRAYVPGEASDPAWYARGLSAELAARAAGPAPVDAVLRESIAAMRDAYAAAVGGADSVPVYAWPFAAVTHVRVSRQGGGLLMEGTHLGDCPVFASGGGNWTPMWQPSIDGDGPAYLGMGLDREALKMHIRRRREEQHGSPRFAVAGMNPDSVEYAKRSRFTAGDAARLVLMTDGFARLFQEYRMMTAGAVLDALQAEGAAGGLLAGLREAEKPERADGRPLIYKNGDDASVMAVRFGEANATGVIIS